MILKRSVLLMALLICSYGYSQNRIATLQDVITYGNFIAIGDLIIDTPTNKFPDGINKVVYTKVSTTFPALRENAIIWIDGDKLGKYCEFRLLNNTETTPWKISSATIKPIPGTRMEGVYTTNSYGGFLHLIQGLKNLRIDGGSCDKYPGLTNFPCDRIFLKGSFGISSSSSGIYTGYHAFSISVLDGGSIYIGNIEGEHGFSVLRLEGGNYDLTASITLENLYVHDSNSETMYIGATHGPPLAKIKDLVIHNVICARSGSESLQMQHLIGNSHISNVTIYSADVGYLSQFQPGQDTGIQLSTDQGQTIIENIILDSWGSHGINIFGSSAYPNNGNSNTILRKIVFSNGRGASIYVHSSCKYGMKWNFEDIYFRKSNFDYYINNKATIANYLVSSNNGTDSISFNRMSSDAVLPKMFQSMVKYKIGSSLIISLPEVQYVNSGFYEPASKIKVWHQYYAKYLTGLDSAATVWNVGDIAIDIQEGSQPVFCKTITFHTSTTISPRNNSNFIVLTWDSNGVRSDQWNWDYTSAQKSYPPDDLRIAKGSYYARLNIGFLQ